MTRPTENRSPAGMRLLALLAGLALLLTAAPAAAVVSDQTPEASASGRYIVLFADPPLAAYGGGIDGLAPTDPEVTGAARLDPASAASQAYLGYLAAQHDAQVAAMAAALGRPVEVIFDYAVTLNGVAVELTDGEAATVASLAGVVRVAPDETRFLQTDNGPAWIGAPSIWDGSGTGGAGATRGEGIVAGILDTGVNFEHPSFAVTGDDGFTHTNPRSQYFGLCDPLTGTPFCNDKLIGVYDFTGSGPQDTNGHGSHTASTTAGNVLDASLVAPTITVDRRISGVAPHANLITYKVCPDLSCLLTAILAAIDQATRDQVDVINYSIGGTSSNPWNDLDSQAFLNARRGGVFVSASAGNSGPGPSTVGSPADAPWLLTVGASTHDRKFINGIVGMSGGATAPPPDLLGKSVTSGYGPAGVVYAGDFGDPLCPTPFPPGTFEGEIVVCDRGVNPRVEKARNVQIGGAGGFVLANDQASGSSTVADPYVIPGVNISFADGQTLKAWLASGTGHTGSILGTIADENPAHGDVMGSFSSRGPNPSVPSVLKPDVTAPGVDILAAFGVNPDPTAPDEYGVISGTSMSSPHAAGSAALVRALHPDWSPDEVKSALMTSALTDGVLKEDAATATDPFDRGGGRVDLTLAGQVGLVLDEAPSSYDAANPAAGGDPSTLNLASLASGNCTDTCLWTRTVTSTAGGAVTWTSVVTAPAGVAISVSPSSFTLEPGATQTITISADVTGAEGDRWHFGEVGLLPDVASVPAAHLPAAIFATHAAPSGDQVTLHFQGNADEGCLGDGRLDLVTCDGPFLMEKPELDAGAAASWKAEPGVSGSADRNIYDPNWVWNLEAPTTLSGRMDLEWWTSCSGCGVFGEDWFIRLWADGAKVFEQRVTTSADLLPEPSLVGTSVVLPEVTADETFVLHVDPVFVDVQHATFVYYDSSGGCNATVAGPCDSIARMPVVGEAALPDLQVTDMAASNVREAEGRRVRLEATVTNAGEADAAASQVAFNLDDGSMIGTAELPVIAPGVSVEVAVSWDTRGVIGEHVVTATADSGGVVAELDEANNSGQLTVDIRGNRVRNSSFEQSAEGSSAPDGWSGESTPAGNASWSAGGSDGERSVTFTGTGENAALHGAPTWTSEAIAVTPGEVLTLSASVSAAGASSAGSVGVAYLGAAGELLNSVTVITAPLTGDGFKTLEGTITVPAGVTQLRVVLTGFAATDVGTSGTVTFDEIGVFGE
jgi:subtilisin family serine protease